MTIQTNTNVYIKRRFPALQRRWIIATSPRVWGPDSSSLLFPIIDAVSTAARWPASSVGLICKYAFHAASSRLACEVDAYRGVHAPLVSARKRQHRRQSPPVATPASPPRRQSLLCRRASVRFTVDVDALHHLD